MSGVRELFKLLARKAILEELVTHLRSFLATDINRGRERHISISVEIQGRATTVRAEEEDIASEIRRLGEAILEVDREIEAILYEEKETKDEQNAEQEAVGETPDWAGDKFGGPGF